MKKFFVVLFICSIGLFLPTSVFADEYQKNVLIPVDTMATVNTEKFLYQDFIYGSQIDENGNATINFTSIHNNTISKSSISINLLLFDMDKKNIGFLSYCTAKDVSSAYSGFKLGGNQSSQFSILVNSKYFVSGKSAKDVSYIAVMDENKYCQIGGYEKYKGLTMEEILKTDSNIVSKNKGFFQKFVHKVSSNFFTSNLIIIFSILIVFFALGILLNELHFKMFGYKNIIAYFPVTDSYVAAKIVFGELVALVYFVLYVISLLLLIFKISFLAYILNFILLVLVCLVIVKLATRNYTLFYLESSMKLLGHNSMTEDSEKRGFFHFRKKKTEEETVDRDTSLLSSDQPTLDLSYDDADNPISLGNSSDISAADSLPIDVEKESTEPSISDLYQYQPEFQPQPSSTEEANPASSNLVVDNEKINELQGDSSLDISDDDDEEKNDFDDFF